MRKQDAWGICVALGMMIGICCPFSITAVRAETAKDTNDTAGALSSSDFKDTNIKILKMVRQELNEAKKIVSSLTKRASRKTL